MEQSLAEARKQRLMLPGHSGSRRLSPIEVIVLVAIFAVAAYVGYRVYGSVTDLNAAAAAPNTYLPAFTTTLTSSASSTGSVVAGQQADLNFGAAGKVADVSVALGDNVTAGQVLARLDDTDLQSALRAAQSSLASAQAKLAAATKGPTDSQVASSKQAIANATSQLATAQQNYTNLQAGPQASSISTAQQGVLSAQNALQTAEDALTKAQQGVVTDQTNLSTAQQNASEAFSALAAPFADLQSDVCSSFAGSLGAPSQASTLPSAPTLTRAEATACDTQFPVAFSSDVSGHLYLAMFSAAPTGTPTVTAQATPTPTTAPSGGSGGSGGSGASQSNSGIYNSDATAYNAAVGKYNTAAAAVITAQTALINDTNSLNNGNLQRSIQSAQLGLTNAQQNLTTAQAGPTSTDLDNAKRSVDAAQAALDSANANYNALFDAPTQDVILPLQNAVDTAQTNVDTAQHNIDNATITAPFDGVVSVLSVAKGDQVAATTTAITIVNPNIVSIQGDIDQTSVSELKPGQAATVTFDALRGFTYRATVATIGLVPTVTQGVVTYPVTFTLGTNLPNGAPTPSPGMTASITVTTSTVPNALVVPSRAIKTSGRNRTVTVHSAEGDETRPVTVGSTSGSLTQVLSGLTAGEQVLVSSAATASSTTGGSGAQGNFQFAGPGGGNIVVGGGGGFGGGGVTRGGGAGGGR
ncbi:MAG TPA: efflux RND transporter periplasmic adaptor subunit [Dehalococcoidia bacterium]|nr:efflux RND transporter periplasmic adaptor subunit [Dehalococcoidia bacterium]